MPILVKCNPSEFADEELSLTLQMERGVELVEGDEVFVWVSEQPRERPTTSGQKGLVARGELVGYQHFGSRATVRVRVCQRFSDERFGMTALVDASADSQAAYRLQSRIGPRRHRLIWSLSSDERDVLDHVLRASDQPITDGILDAELTRIVELMRSRIAVAGSDRSGRNPPRSSPEDADIFEMLVQRWHEQNDVCPLCQKEIPLRTENKLLQMSPDRMDSSDIHYDWPNTRLTHLACNLGKSDATLDEWWAYLGMIRQTS